MLTRGNFYSLLISVCLLLGAGCAAQFASAPEVQPHEVTGTYTLILYGGRHGNDVETVAFLSREGSGYTFVMNAPDFDYKVMPGMPAAEAIKYAEEAVRFHPHSWRTELRPIVAPDGRTIGYEMRPLYQPLTFGESNIMDVKYAFRASTVSVTVRLHPHVRRQLDGDDPRDRPFLFRR
jgi:hypothetical protein